MCFWLIGVVLLGLGDECLSQTFQQKLDIDQSNIYLMITTFVVVFFITVINSVLSILRAKSESYLNSVEEEIQYTENALKDITPMVDIFVRSTEKHRDDLAELAKELYGERKKLEKKAAAVDKEYEKNRKRARLASDLENVRNERKLMKTSDGDSTTQGDSIAAVSTPGSNLNTSGDLTMTSLLPGKRD
ncbi:hypothetical protein M3Y96_01035100 [Aphelenchoides besseyi]|nr:hypothetical protein M3Y96_01035100 [Aphelenchoides besseyi]